MGGDGFQSASLLMGKAHSKHGKQYPISMVGVDPSYEFVIGLTNLPKVILLMITEEEEQIKRFHVFMAMNFLIFLLYFWSLPQTFAQQVLEKAFSLY